MYYKIEQIMPQAAQGLFSALMGYFPNNDEDNARYAQGILERNNIAVQLNNTFVGLLSFDFPYPESARIYWLGIMPEYRQRGLGTLLIQKACHLAHDHGSEVLTVATIDPDQVVDELNTQAQLMYNFYMHCGFVPLISIKPEQTQHTLIYLAKWLDKATMTTFTKLAFFPLDDSLIQELIKQFNFYNILLPDLNKYLQEQQSGERLFWVAFYDGKLAGYVSLKWLSVHREFSAANIPEITDLKLLPNMHHKGITANLLELAENAAAQKNKSIGLSAELLPHTDIVAVQHGYTTSFISRTTMGEKDRLPLLWKKLDVSS